MIILMTKTLTTNVTMNIRIILKNEFEVDYKGDKTMKSITVIIILTMTMKIAVAMVMTKWASVVPG